MGGDVIIEENVGIGTSSPAQALHVSGNIAIGTQATPAIVVYDKNSETTHPDVQFDGNALLASEGTFAVNIDSDNSGTDAEFTVNINAPSSSATEVFKITEAGLVSASAFTGDGSGLTNLIAGNVTGFVTTPVENGMVTTNATGIVTGKHFCS